MFVIFLLVLFHFSEASATVNETEFYMSRRNQFMRKTFTEYFKYLKFNVNIQRFAHFCIFFVDNTTEASDVATVTMKSLYCPGVSMTNFLQKVKRTTFTASVMFVFMKDVRSLNHSLSSMLRMKIYNVRIYTFFVFCAEIADDSFMDQVLMSLWKHGFIRYVVLFIRKNKDLEIMTYDPFRGKKIKFNKKTPVKKLFPDILYDLNGYQFRVSMFEDWPTLKKDKSSNDWKGLDYDLLQSIVRTLNATYRIVEPPEATAFSGAHNDIVNNRTDFCFVRYFQMENFDDVEFSYSPQLDPVHVFVPVPPRVQQYSYMFLIFEIEVWCTIAFVATIVMILLKIVTVYYYDLPNCTIMQIALEIWAIMLSVPNKNLGKMQAAVKCVILPWIVTCLILSTAFQSILRNQLQFPKYQRGLETLADLSDNDVKIYSAISFTNITLDVPKLNKNIVMKTNQQIKKMWESSDYSGAYLVPFFSMKPPNRNHFRKSTRYLMLAEPILTGHGVYMFKKNTPFLEKFNYMISTQRENGMFSGVYESEVIAKTMVDEGVPEKISLFQLQGAFLAYTVGMLIALLFFLKEVTHFNTIQLK